MFHELIFSNGKIEILFGDMEYYFEEKILDDSKKKIP